MLLSWWSFLQALSTENIFFISTSCLFSFIEGRQASQCKTVSEMRKLRHIHPCALDCRIEIGLLPIQQPQTFESSVVASVLLNLHRKFSSQFEMVGVTQLPLHWSTLETYMQNMKATLQRF